MLIHVDLVNKYMPTPIILLCSLKCYKYFTLQACNFIQKETLACRPATLFKKRLLHIYFSVNFAKFLRTPPGNCFFILFFWNILVSSAEIKIIKSWNSTQNSEKNQCVNHQPHHTMPVLFLCRCEKHLFLYEI